MTDAQLTDKPSSRETLPRCPMCQARMKVLRVVPGRPGFEHWTLRCRTCGLVNEAQTSADPINSEA
jgi:hypothetical protein